MAIPTNKKELLEAIEINYQKLAAELESIPVNKTAIVELDGHKKDTKMSICNLVAYLIGWGELVIKWHHQLDVKEPIDFPETGFNWNQLGELAQKFYADYEKESYPNLLKKLQKVVEQIRALINQQSNSKLYQDPVYKTYPMGRMVQLNTSSPYKNAKSRIRKWKKMNGLN